MDGSSYAVYEEHLKQLEEQLVTVTIEYQNILEELQGYKDKESLTKLKTEIGIERSRYLKLEEKYKKLLRENENKKVQSVDSAHGWVDVSIKSDETDDTKKSLNQSKPIKPSKIDSLWRRIVESFYTIMDNFSEESDKDTSEDDGPQLTVKQLKENIKRFKSDLQPYIDTVKGIQQMLAWKTPSYTLLMFMIFLLSVWFGCLSTVILFCVIFRLSISYLNHLGFSIRFNFFQPIEEKKEKEDPELGLSDKFNLVIMVARKVQNFLGWASDSLEKVNSLLTWKTPITKKLYFGLILMFIVTMTTIPMDYSHVFGIFVGIKLFIINYFYNRYPRLKQKYDSTAKMWKELPTTAQYERRCAKTEIKQYLLTDSDKEEEDKPLDSQKIKETDKEFCHLFQLPNSEIPLEGWKGGKRCSLINKDKVLSSAFNSGKLYLTRSFLCLERKKKPSKENLVIPLAEIENISKTKPFTALPGSGMSIEIKLHGNKMFTFGAIISRDDVFDSIIQAGIEQNLPWATGQPSSTNISPHSSLRRRGSSKVMHFTWASDYVESE